MRNLVTVIDQMMSVIPTENTSLIIALTSRRSSAEYSAPELMGLRWRTVADTLADHISQDETEWTPCQKEVVKIWMGE